MSRIRRTFTADQKAEAVRRHLSGKEAVSDLGDALGVQPSHIHNWSSKSSIRPIRRLSVRPEIAGSRPPRTAASNNCRPSWPTRTKSFQNSWRRTSRQKKSLGSSERTLGSPRYSRRDRGLRQAMDKADGASGQAAAGVAATRRQQVPPGEGSLRPGERAQHDGCPATVGWRIGKSRLSSTTTTAIRWKATAAWRP